MTGFIYPKKSSWIRTAKHFVAYAGIKACDQDSVIFRAIPEPHSGYPAWMRLS